MSRNWSRLRRFMSAKQSRFPSGITAFLGHKVRIQPTDQVLPTLMLLGRMYGSGMPVVVIALCAGILGPDRKGADTVVGFAPWANPHIPVGHVPRWRTCDGYSGLHSSPVTRPSDIFADFGRAWYAAERPYGCSPHRSALKVLAVASFRERQSGYLPD
jgi:hypothetical protein